MPIVHPSPDPDDALPPTAILHDHDAPCSVPSNPEAMGQWATRQLTSRSWAAGLPTSPLRFSIAYLSELPLVRNHFYAAKNFRKRKMPVRLPPVLTWTVQDLRTLTTVETVNAMSTFLRSTPWQYTLQDEVSFSGMEMAWLIVLGFMMYFDAYSTTSPELLLGHLDLGRLVNTFKEYIQRLSQEFTYPRFGPSAKYGVAPSREAYLFTVISAEEPFVRLLQLIEHLPDTGSPSPTTLLSGKDFPSWQSPRCGLPPSMHADVHTVDALHAWLVAPPSFLNEVGTLISGREQVLLDMLKAVCLYSDVQSILFEDWDAKGQLANSCLRSAGLDFTSLLLEWAEARVLMLEQAVGPIPDRDMGDPTLPPSNLDIELSGPARSPSPAGPASPAHPASTAGTASTAARAVPADPIGHDNHLSTTDPGTGVLRRPVTPDPQYLEAARAIPRDRSQMQAMIHESTQPPVTERDIRRKVAIEAYNRRDDQVQRNTQIRSDNKRLDAERSRSTTRAAPEPRPTMSELPRLPTPALPSHSPSGNPEQTLPPSPPPPRKRRPKPVEVQALAKVTVTRPLPKRKVKPSQAAVKRQKAAAVGSARAKRLPPNKRPLPSTRKRAEEPDSDLEDDSTPTLSDAETASPTHRSQPEGNADLSDAVDDVELPPTISHLAHQAATSPSARRRKRRRQDTVTQRDQEASQENAPADSQSSPSAHRPLSKRKRVEVLMPAKPKSYVVGHPKPKPRAVLRPGSRAARAAAAAQGSVQHNTSTEVIVPQSPEAHARLRKRSRLD
ncbi:unnamed protein product [Peniophora sp. CBMAI 1063]|nr:unnamed protein product [Peniophora sp. CBMAI 1063]